MQYWPSIDSQCVSWNYRSHIFNRAGYARQALQKKTVCSSAMFVCDSVAYSSQFFPCSDLTEILRLKIELAHRNDSLESASRLHNAVNVLSCETFCPLNSCADFFFFNLRVFIKE